MRIFLLILTLFSVMLSCKDDNIKYKYYDTGEISEKIDLNEGMYYEYYKNGSLKLVSGYKKNFLHGKVIHYYKNGIVKDSGYFYKGMPKGIAYFYNKEGSLESVGEYVILGNKNKIKSYLNNIIVFNEKGDTVFDKSHTYNIKYKNDTVNFNNDFNFYVIIKTSMFDSIGVLLGDFDSIYNIQDTLSYKAFRGINDTIKCNIKFSKKGKNIIRGIIEDFTITDTAYLSRPMYFSFPVYVK